MTKYNIWTHFDQFLTKSVKNHFPWKWSNLERNIKPWPPLKSDLNEGYRYMFLSKINILAQISAPRHPFEAILGHNFWTNWATDIYHLPKCSIFYALLLCAQMFFCKIDSFQDKWQKRFYRIMGGCFLKFFHPLGP